MYRSERPTRSLRPNNEAHDRTRGQHEPASTTSPSLLKGETRGSPNKGDHQQNEKPLLISPDAGDEYLQHQDRVQERNVAKVRQMLIGKIQDHGYAKQDAGPQQRFQGIHQTPVP